MESEKIEERPTVRGEKITWRLYADLDPLKDVVVHVSIPTSNNQSADVWVLIPKFNRISEEFTDTIYDGAIEVVALPMLSIVGEGLVVNVEELQKGLPTDTYGGHRIRKDFDFPLYNVGNPSQILCDDCSAPVSSRQPALPSNLPSATSVHVSPVPRATIPSNPQFVLTFNENVLAATINGVAATGSGRNWRASPVLAGESVSLDVRWTNRDGSTSSTAVGPYTVRDPDKTSPRLIRGTVANGDIKVDPRQINERGLRFDFDEIIRGSIKLVDNSGINLNWIANVSGRAATLTPPGVGRKLGFRSTYFIEIDVRDTTGNPSQIQIVFFTDMVKR